MKTKCSKCGIGGLDLKDYGYCKSCKKEVRKKWADSHKKEIREYQKIWVKENPEKMKAGMKRYHLKNRMLVLTHYGGNPPKCACCGETILEFLTVDHKNNDGAEHRKKVTTYMPTWLVRNNFPSDFQILCFNCNLCKGIYRSSVCPHKRLGNTKDDFLQKERERIIKEIEELRRTYIIPPRELVKSRNRRDIRITQVKYFNYNKALDDIINLLNQKE